MGCEAEASEATDGTLVSWSGSVLPEWIDYNDHMTESRYLQCFGEATDALLRRIGVDAAYLATQRSFYTVETHLMHLGQARRGDHLAVTTQVLGGDAKKLHIFHRLCRGSEVVASAEQMLLHVDAAAGRAAPADGPVRDAVLALVARHAGLPRPEAAGRSVGARRGG